MMYTTVKHPVLVLSTFVALYMHLLVAIIGTPWNNQLYIKKVARGNRWLI